MLENIIKFNKLDITANPPIGLALGSGAMRGLAHIGVISEFEKAGISVREICGSSAGALFGCLYAAGMTPGEVEEAAVYLKPGLVFDLGIPFFGFFRGRRLKKFLKDIFHKRLKIKDLRDTKIKAFVVAVDILNGSPVIFSSGDIVDIIMASCAVPMLFSPYRLGGRKYIDGGILCPVPARILKGRGNVVVGVDLGFSNLMKKTPSLLHVAGQSIIIMGRKLLNLQENEADILVRPEFSDIGYWNFDRAGDILKAGKKAGAEAAVKILKMLRPEVRMA